MHQPFQALAQGKVDYEVEVISMKLDDKYSTSPVMVVMATEEAIYITKEQAMKFFGLAVAEIPPPTR